MLVKFKDQTEALTALLQKKRKHVLVDTIKTLHQCFDAFLAISEDLSLNFFSGEHPYAFAATYPIGWGESLEVSLRQTSKMTAAGANEGIRPADTSLSKIVLTTNQWKLTKTRCQVKLMTEISSNTDYISGHISIQRQSAPSSFPHYSMRDIKTHFKPTETFQTHTFLL